MTTYVDSSHVEVSSFYRRPSTTTTTTTASSVSANMPTFSKASEGLEGVPSQIFTTIKSMQKAIDSCQKKSKASKASPYLIFRLVTTNSLLKIEDERERGEISRGIRMTHYVDWNILVVKVPTAEHEVAHREFGYKLRAIAAAMGLEGELVDIGSTTFKTPRVSKEGDTTLRPRSIRPRKADWPTIVIESGWSESLSRLRQDAHIWLEDSRGDVKIVVLFSICQTARSMIIEKWENRPVPANPPVPANRPATRSTTATIPTQMEVITIDTDSDRVTGAPLTLEFQKIFLRQAVPPLEHDYTFTDQDLLAFGTFFWGSVQ
jgi:hypothetical protein